MNKQLIFEKRPIGTADASTWSLKTNPIPELEDGEILVKNHYISLDPAMRGWMNAGKSYIAPVEIGAVMRAGSVGEVIKVKNHSTFKAGDFISGHGGVHNMLLQMARGIIKLIPN